MKWRAIKMTYRFLLLFPVLVFFGMLEGVCPKCGIQRIGWALRNPRHQTCPKCGEGLQITESGRSITTGYSPFTAEKYLIDSPQDMPAERDKKSGGEINKG